MARIPPPTIDYKNAPIPPFFRRGHISFPGFRSGSNQDPTVGSGTDNTYKLRRKKKPKLGSSSSKLGG